MATIYFLFSPRIIFFSGASEKKVFGVRMEMVVYRNGKGGARK